MVSVVITAAGTGSRAGFEENKIFKLIGKKSVIETTFDSFSLSGLVDEIIITANQEDFNRLKDLFPLSKVVIGGKTRQQSVLNGLNHVSGDIVLIHDGARPFVTKEIIKDCIESVKKFGSGISAYPSTDTIAIGKDGFIEQNLGKEEMFIIQTPQGFYTNDILRAHARANGNEPDDSILYLRHVGKPHLSLGSKENRKLTLKEDFIKESAVGVGYDTHKLTENRRLVLGGVTIPHDKGLLGHSDADVLTHAVMDALLSAAGLRDIGYYFPDNDNKYKDISSIVLLKEVMRLIANEGYSVGNVTACILAEKPKLSPFIETIKNNLANELGISLDKLGITVTTTEGLGFIGREEGIAVHSTCTLVK